MSKWDDLILRLARAADSPHVSPRAAQHQRIAKKIEGEYARGNLDRAARWDERLTGWEERMDDALADVQDNWSEMSGGRAIDDAATGVSPVMAARYAEHLSDLGSFSDRADLVANLRAVAEDGLSRYPTPRQPSDEDVFAFAKQVFEERQALRDRYRQPPAIKVITVDELIRRLGAPD
jgi:hypothetical protein